MVFACPTKPRLRKCPTCLRRAGRRTIPRSSTSSACTRTPRERRRAPEPSICGSPPRSSPADSLAEILELGNGTAHSCRNGPAEWATPRSAQTRTATGLKQPNDGQRPILATSSVGPLTPSRPGPLSQLREGAPESAVGCARLALPAVGDSFRSRAHVQLASNGVRRVPLEPVPAPVGVVAPRAGATGWLGGGFHTCGFAQAPPSPPRLACSMRSDSQLPGRDSRRLDRCCYGLHV